MAPSAPAARAQRPAAQGTGLIASADPATGVYRVSDPTLGWTFAGHIAGRLRSITRTHGAGAFGPTETLTLRWSWHGVPVQGQITTWRDRPVARFALTFLRATPAPRLAFPDFHRLPPRLFVFSYRDAVFSPPQFRAGRSASPWLLFQAFRRRGDWRYCAAVLSPAGHFQTEVLRGDGAHRAAVRLDSTIAQAPAGTTVRSLLAVVPGINRAFRAWGRALLALHGIRRQTAGPLIRDLGYWTDNGAHYYYHYRPALGYAGTLLAEVRHLRQRRIPVRYLQLDSWWYPKDAMNYNGRLLRPKNAAYAGARWNIYGGTWLYHASPILFPHGLAAFQQALGLPLAVHGRWISQRSPYHRRYRILGIAPVDPAYWRHVAAYLHRSGVMTYEQDWLSIIRRYSGFARHLGRGGAFFATMAHAMARDGLRIQYCMPMPSELLEASRFGNVTTSRVSDDHFVRARWWSFLFTSRLASALGVKPWADVTSSRSVDAILLQTLSGGPVGFGAAMGRADRSVLMQAVRADGRIVHPATTLVPVAADYRNAALGLDRPVIGRAFTGAGATKTAYVFAFARHPGDITGPARFTAREVGLHGAIYVWNYFTHHGEWVQPGQSFQAPLAANQAAYFICAMPGPSGIAFLGDGRQFVGNGPARIARLRQMATGVKATVLLADGDSHVELHGYSPFRPEVRVSGGAAGPVRWSARSGEFRFRVRAAAAPGRRLRRVRVVLSRRLARSAGRQGRSRRLDAGPQQNLLPKPTRLLGAGSPAA